MNGVLIMTQEEMQSKINVGLMAKQVLEGLEKRVDDGIHEFNNINPASFYSRLQDPEVRASYNAEVAIRSIINEFLSVYTIEEILHTIECYKTKENFRMRGLISQGDFEKALGKYGFKYEEFISLGCDANNYVRECRYYEIMSWTEEYTDSVRKEILHIYINLLFSIERLCHENTDVYSNRIEYEYKKFGFDNTAWYKKFDRELKKNEQCKVEIVATKAIEENLANVCCAKIDGTCLVAIKRALEETINIWENLSSQEIRAIYIRDNGLIAIAKKYNTVYSGKQKIKIKTDVEIQQNK